MLRNISFIPSLLATIIIKVCSIFQMLSLQLDHIVIFLHSINNWYYIDGFLFAEPGKLCLPEINITCTWCTFLMCCWINFTSILLRIFACIFIKVIIDSLFCFVRSLSDLGIKIILA